jgi:hypothetical protein
MFYRIGAAMMTHTDEAKRGIDPISKTALVEAVVNCPVCGREGSALYTSMAECCQIYLLTWFRDDAA